MHASEPLVVAFVSDLFFSTRIESAAGIAGFGVHLLERADALPGRPEPTAASGEALSGSTGSLLDWLSQLQPALLIFDIDSKTLPWELWIASLKSAPATRRLPILCYGSHVDTERSARARDAGADAVIGKGRFTQALPQLIQKHARRLDLDAISADCAEAMSAEAQSGLQLFEAGDYFAAHEALERAWKAEAGPGRELYRGLLQIAVACLQIERGNFNGAVKMFWRARQWLEPLPAACRGVDTHKLRTAAAAVLAQIQQLGSTRIAETDCSSLRPSAWMEPIP
jgi:predicted metal-dependent hydrolase/CheY-like chemotaxis protein